MVIQPTEVIFDPYHHSKKAQPSKYPVNSLIRAFKRAIAILIILIIMWVFAAFGEEFLFRGFSLKGLANLFGSSNKAWLLAALISSVYFGVSHSYQGLVGVISVLLWSFLISLIFCKNKKNLLLLVLIHGFSDTIGLSLIYFNKDHLISEWIIQMLLT
ncbi:CPBP family intramembrane glutamic endopeptidase [Nonlabens xiamenensis]|uniref:CPBP family intramembrane glutamic endopeptidase n=1 Tax=Nonlabens xiamenensis TaxID=2341043 RepID=UPI000F60D561